MMRTTLTAATFLAVFALNGNMSSTFAQGLPWVIFLDPLSDSACDLVNAENAELVVLADTGEFVIVTGFDELLVDTFVDADGFVFFNGFPVGTVEFAVDGDGFRTLWWLDSEGFVVRVNPDTGAPQITNQFPEDFIDVPCDACEFWDDPDDCFFDEDGDGVPDEFDFCPDTPFGESVDFDGCACFEVDSDSDGVDDCDDFCPDTPLNTFVTVDGCPCGEFDEDDDGINDCFDDCPGTPFGSDVDDDGCEIVVIVNPPPVFIACGNFSALAMALTFGALLTIRLARRRF